MSGSIKEIIVKFFIMFLVLLVIGHFIPKLELTMTKSLVISIGISLVDFVAYVIIKPKRR